jgi:hypothetical protein
MHKFIPIILLFNLIGCASYNSSFECKPCKGIACTSVSRINSRVDRGNLAANKTKKVKKETIKIPNKIPFPITSTNNLPQMKVARIPETTMRIWIAPFVSEHDGYIEAQYVHEVVEKSSWCDERE